MIELITTNNKSLKVILQYIKINLLTNYALTYTSSYVTSVIIILYCCAMIHNYISIIFIYFRNKY